MERKKWARLREREEGEPREDYASFEETEGGRYESGRSQLSHKSYTLLHGRGDKKSRFRDATSLSPPPPNDILRS